MLCSLKSSPLSIAQLSRPIIAVTELAIVHTTSTCVPHPLKQVLINSNNTFNNWAAAKSDLDFEGAWQFQQIEDPSVLLFTVNWKDTQAHWQWLATEECGQITSHILPFVGQPDDGKPRIELWHAMFGPGLKEGEEVPLVDSPVISVVRHFVAPGEKAAFEKKFNQVKGLYCVEQFAQPHSVRGAWKVEDEESETAEWVVIAGWPSVERHMEFAKHETFAIYRELMDLFVSFEVRHYRRSV